QTLVDPFPGVTFSAPIDLEALTDGSGRLFVVERAGRIKIFDNDPGVTNTKTFLDISSKVLTEGELGLLGIALHPDFATNGYVYAHYATSPQKSVIARFTRDETNPDTVATGSEEVVLEQTQPFQNHNGGKIQFGPDGYLYIGFGDGGDAHDPFGHGQSKSTMLGAFLRLDVDGGGSPPDCGSSGPTAYTVPADNPFVDGPGGDCDEIWAYGFRNPWRWSFDQEGTLWVGDVGQGCREEIDRVAKMGNYGWDLMEGFFCHPDPPTANDCTLEPPDDCSSAGLNLPIHDYSRNLTTGGRAVTGGFVYRGSTCAPYLTGAYVYGDYISGNIWAMAFAGDSLVSNSLLLDSGFNPVSFGEDADGELYVINPAGSLRRFDCSAMESVVTVHEEGWQQISLPVETISMKVTDALASASLGAPVFGFQEGRFGAVEWLEPGRGYLAYFAAADTIEYVGSLVDPRLIDVSAGWNLIGPFELDTAVGSITPTGANVTSPFFGLSSGYSSVSTLESGRGYWVAVDSDGTLELP
ncbi:MAG TPA: PQQ-dependent sugar dehydrogenase, partial [Rhodothermales bacterium]